MLEYLQNLFSTENFIPHGNSFLWYPDVLWLHVISGITIAFASFTIALTILHVVKKNSAFTYRWILLMFAAVVFMFGLISLLGVVVIWHPIYRFEAIVKALAAGVSVAMAILLLPLIPRAINIYYQYLERENGLPGPAGGTQK